MANSELRLQDCEVSYWETEGGNFVASLKSPVASGLLILRSGFKPDDEWKLLPLNSPSWNWFHQCIFRNFRADEVPAERVRDLPPLPAVLSLGEELPAEHFLTPSKPLLSVNYPAIVNYLDFHARTSITIHVVLLEDLYESKLGDGKFHDLNAVCLSAEETEACAKEIETERWYRAHRREMTLSTSEMNIAIPDFRLELFDTESVEEVLATLEKKLRQNSTVDHNA